MFLHTFRSSKSKVRIFKAGRECLSDIDFARKCGLTDDPKTNRIAIAVRRAVANVGLVESDYIFPEDSYPGSLEKLPVWDSMDWMTFVMELERELEIEISDEDSEIFTHLHHFTVDELVHIVCRYLKIDVK